MKTILLKVWTYVVIFTYYFSAYIFYLLRWITINHKKNCDKHSSYIKSLINNQNEN